jgi:hypothetical protein
VSTRALVVAEIHATPVRVAAYRQCPGNLRGFRDPDGRSNAENAAHFSRRDGSTVLLLVSGSSGVGKSTARRAIQDALSPSVESAELTYFTPLPAFPDLRWRQQTAELAAQRARELAAAGRHLLLAGDPVVAGEIVAVPTAPMIDIAILLLDADEATQTERLRRRGDPDELLHRHVGFAAWMRRHAVDPWHLREVITEDSWEQMDWDRRPKEPWQIPILDTTHLSEAEVAAEVLGWARNALAGSAPVFRAD